MILQVLADARQLVLHSDALGLELGFRANAREHQQLRAAEGASAEQHLLARLERQRPALDPHLHAAGLLALQQNALGQRAGEHAEVVARPHLFEEGGGGAPAAAVADGHVVLADTLLLGAVEVRIEAVPGFAPGFDKGLGGPMGRRAADIQLAAVTMKIAGAAMVHLALAKIRQHLVERPAIVAQSRPVVVVAAMTADIDHAVDRTAAAKHLAARLITATPAQACLRLGGESPVDVAGRQDRGDAGRHMDQWRAVFRPGFEQTHGHRRIGAQAVGQQATGRASTDDDVIEFHGNSETEEARELFVEAANKD
ncbi:hypothetical protein D3C85_942460 [compost metagenome]